MNDRSQLQSWLNRLNDILKSIYPSYEAEGEIRYCIHYGHVLTLTAHIFKDDGPVIIGETGESKEEKRWLYEDTGVYYLDEFESPEEMAQKIVKDYE